MSVSELTHHTHPQPQDVDVVAAPDPRHKGEPHWQGGGHTGAPSAVAAAVGSFASTRVMLKSATTLVEWLLLQVTPCPAPSVPQVH